MASSLARPAILGRDPMAHLYSVREHILEHLDANDLLVGSLCSKLWYEVIAVSDALKNKVELKASVSKINPEIIQNSERQYEIIHKIGGKDGNELLFLNSKYFKKVQFSIDVEKMSEYLEYLERFAHSVRILAIWETKVKIKDSDKIPFFPNLTDLSMDNVSVLTLLPFVRCHHKLNFVDFGDIQDEAGVSSKDVVSKILEKNRSITHLTLSTKLINDLFENDMSKVYRFKLKKFNIFSASRQKNVEKFLVSHGETLNQVTFMIMGDVVKKKMAKREKDFLSVYNVWSKLKVLKKLFLVLIRFKEQVLIDEQFVKTLNLKPNYGITEVAVQADNTDIDMSLSLLKDILLLCPNLEFFRTEYLNKGTMIFLVKNMRKLKVIKCDSIEPGCLAMYNDLKDFDPTVNSNVDIDGLEAETNVSNNLEEQLGNLNIN
ncbi:unnamed protein product [Diamesa serratosioi]